MVDINCCSDKCRFSDCGKCAAPAAKFGDTKAITGDCDTCGHFQAKGDC